MSPKQKLQKIVTEVDCRWTNQVKLMPDRFHEQTIVSFENSKCVRSVKFRRLKIIFVVILLQNSSEILMRPSWNITKSGRISHESLVNHLL